MNFPGFGLERSRKAKVCYTATLCLVTKLYHVNFYCVYQHQKWNTINNLIRLSTNQPPSHVPCFSLLGHASLPE